MREISQDSVTSIQLSISMNCGPRTSVGVKRTRGRPKYQAVRQCVSHGGCLWEPLEINKGIEVGNEAGLLASFPFISVLLRILLGRKRTVVQKFENHCFSDWLTTARLFPTMPLPSCWTNTSRMSFAIVPHAFDMHNPG